MLMVELVGAVFSVLFLMRLSFICGYRAREKDEREKDLKTEVWAVCGAKAETEGRCR